MRIDTNSSVGLAVNNDGLTPSTTSVLTNPGRTLVTRACRAATLSGVTLLAALRISALTHAANRRSSTLTTSPPSARQPSPLREPRDAEPAPRDDSVSLPATPTLLRHDDHVTVQRGSGVQTVSGYRLPAAHGAARELDDDALRRDQLRSSVLASHVTLPPRRVARSCFR